MPALDVKPLILKNVILSLKLTDDAGEPLEFQKHVSAVQFTPKSDTKTWSGLGGNTHTDTGPSTWTCDLTYIQDWKSAESLSRFLFENEGKTADASFTPITAGPAFTSNVSITPGAIGGKVGEFAEQNVSLGSDKPQLVND
ncbi:hypothetical protein [Leifsonia poae]|uniref:hypothetical protein n=1 Tax=Leifsonia poae TaxID=110933 RepID=UPI001CBE25D2|nr:hypothetical protein [Leifsonia poae]